MSGKILYNLDRKFDIQLAASRIRELDLGELLASGKIELKSESWQWEQTGNICIEFACDGQPSGIATTEADVWVHELLRDGELLVQLWFRVERLKRLARAAYRRGDWRKRGGDRKRFSVVLLSIDELVRGD